MSWVLAIDFGTANTTAAHAGDGAAPQPLTLEGLPSLPSVVAADPDGRLVVGRAARSQAYLDPERAEPPSPERPVAENPGGGQITAARWTPDDRYLLTSLGNRSRPADQVGKSRWKTSLHASPAFPSDGTVCVESGNPKTGSVRPLPVNPLPPSDPTKSSVGSAFQRAPRARARAASACCT